MLSLYKKLSLYIHTNYYFISHKLFPTVLSLAVRLCKAHTGKTKNKQAFTWLFPKIKTNLMQRKDCLSSVFQCMYIKIILISRTAMVRAKVFPKNL